MPSTTPPAAPASLCLLRLSALGDVSHLLPVVRTLQAVWPTTRLSWIIGRSELGLVGDIPGIEFLVLDKRAGWRGYQALRHQLAGRRFDLLLHLQPALRASLASLLVRADRKLGFDRPRAKDGQWLFTNARIDGNPRVHVVDGFFAFLERLGIHERRLDWSIPIPAAAHAFAQAQLPATPPLLAISPCASKPYRNWPAERYAAVADAAIERHGMAVVLTGGPSALERHYADAITRTMRQRPIDLVGATDLKQLLALLSRCRLLIAPDSGPAHLATAVGTPVIGLYAATNPDRAGPYLSRHLTVNAYPEALAAAYGRPVEAMPWGSRVRTPGTMERIGVDAVLARLAQALAE